MFKTNYTFNYLNYSSGNRKWTPCVKEFLEMFIFYNYKMISFLYPPLSPRHFTVPSRLPDFGSITKRWVRGLRFRWLLKENCLCFGSCIILIWLGTLFLSCICGFHNLDLSLSPPLFGWGGWKLQPRHVFPIQWYLYMGFFSQKESVVYYK